MRNWITIFLLALYTTASMQAFELRTGISGRVLDANTREPVRRAAIKIYASKNEWNEFTDGQGRFRFPDLVPGDYTLIVHRDGYSDRAYKLERSDFESPKELLIEVHRQGVITGRVLDNLGQAL